LANQDTANYEPGHHGSNTDGTSILVLADGEMDDPVELKIELDKPEGIAGSKYA
jgi:hypothetical protein